MGLQTNAVTCHSVNAGVTVIIHFNQRQELVLHVSRKSPTENQAICMEILLALTCCVRAFNLRQIADGYFAGNVNKARRLLSGLVSQQLLIKNRLPIRELQPLELPLAKWRVGEDAPNFGSLVVTIRSRWQSAPTKLTPIYLAGPSAARMLGYRTIGTLKRPLQASHDLGLAGVYLAVRRDRHQLAMFWYGEDIAPKQLGSVPDAIYIDGDGNTELAFEFCGLYSVNRLRTFHRHCAERRLSYELW